MARKSIKRENGTGSVYKRKDLKRRPWVAVAPAELIRDDDARKVNAKQMIIGHYATAQEAKTRWTNIDVTPPPSTILRLRNCVRNGCLYGIPVNPVSCARVMIHPGSIWLPYTIKRCVKSAPPKCNLSLRASKRTNCKAL